MLNMKPKGVSNEQINRLQKMVVMARIEKMMREYIKIIKRLRPDYEKASRKARRIGESIDRNQYYLDSLIKRRDSLYQELSNKDLNKESVKNEPLKT